MCIVSGKMEQPLWMDRRWTGPDFERDSNSSEKKLIPVSTTISSFCASARDNNNTNNAVEENEYAYIDRKSLSTFSGIHSMAINGSELHQSQKHISPEPYATTDILRNSASSSSNVNNMLSNDKNSSIKNGGSQTQLYAVRIYLFSNVLTLSSILEFDRHIKLQMI